MTRFFILAFIKKRKRLRLRLINKGRNNLKENDRSALLRDLKYLLSNTPLNNIHFPKYLLNGIWKILLLQMKKESLLLSPTKKTSMSDGFVLVSSAVFGKEIVTQVCSLFGLQDKVIDDAAR